MLSHEEMVRLQAEKHELISGHSFQSEEEYVLHLMHTASYLQAARLSENKKVLDLGCNTGYGTEILSKVARHVVGVDVSEQAISVAQKKYGNRRMKFQLIDGTQIPFKDNEFDVVVSFQVIEHIVNYSVYIGELKRVLSPGGIVMFTTPNALLRLDPGMKPWNEFHVREFDNSELESLLSTFFSEVQLMGLFAKEPLYSIEANRLNSARENARRRINVLISHSKLRMRSLIKSALPTSAVSRLRSIKTSLSHKIPEIDKSFIENYGVDDFFYRPNNLETALDLLAICSDDETSFQGIQHHTRATIA